MHDWTHADLAAKGQGAAAKCFDNKTQRNKYNRSPFPFHRGVGGVVSLDAVAAVARAWLFFAVSRVSQLLQVLLGRFGLLLKTLWQLC